MAKTLIFGETVTNQYGDVWDAAILVCDYCTLDFLDANFRFRVDIYKDAAARTARENAVQQWYTIDQATFNANFDPDLATTTMKPQSEDYAIIMEIPGSDPPELAYGDKFE
jgi:hypothetical protein